MTELYDFLELEKTYYSRFIKSNLLENPFFEAGKDYLHLSTSDNLGKKGQFRQDFYVHIDAAKKLCMVSKSRRGNEIRDWLVKLTNEVEGGVLLNAKQVLELVKIVKVFSVYEHRQKAMKQNQTVFIQDLLEQKPNTPEGVLYGKFHIWRNEVLNIGKEVLDQRLKEYCIVNHKAYNRNLNKDDIFSILGEYEHIKVAVWDLLTSKKNSEEFVKNISILAQDLAKEMKPFLQRLNESDLFFEKIEKGIVQDVFRLN
jgi:phage anti-repressor protein